jgi:lactoylglutathione lyase
VEDPNGYKVELIQLGTQGSAAKQETVEQVTA